MISAWQIYLVMQLDSINAAVMAVFWISVCVFVVASGVYLMIFDCDEGFVKKWLSALKKTGVVAAASLLVAAFIPSSKTAAAMIVIPAIANNEAIQKEAGDLYQLAKKGLANLVSDDKSEQSK